MDLIQCYTDTIYTSIEHVNHVRLDPQGGGGFSLNSVAILIKKYCKHPGCRTPKYLWTLGND